MAKQKRRRWKHVVLEHQYADCSKNDMRAWFFAHPEVLAERGWSAYKIRSFILASDRIMLVCLRFHFENPQYRIEQKKYYDAWTKEIIESRAMARSSAV